MFLQDPYMLKALEYLLGVVFLMLFVGFWHYATGGRTAVAAPRAARVPAPEDMFRVPAGVMLHPGHAWARLERPGVMAVGVDQFAQQLVGPVDGIRTAKVGDAVEQGDPAWSLEADSRWVDMLAPVSGRVLLVNERAIRDPRLLNEDPYGRGWLMLVEVPRFATTIRQLLTGTAARHLMSSSWEDLSALMSPGLGPVMHDGGVPVQGIARAIDEARWDEVARRLLLS
jgi:glycine cleavage system H lipoate-binding protein